LFSLNFLRFFRFLSRIGPGAAAFKRPLGAAKGGPGTGGASEAPGGPLARPGTEDGPARETRENTVSAMYCHMISEDTACVFHMMRVLEGGIAALALDVGRTFERQNWQNIIDEIECEITKFRKTGPNTPEKQERLKFLSVAAKELFYFKDGWRNHVAHSRIRYDEHQAVSTMEHVRAFMAHLATRLSMNIFD
jgi:hypothetical protein